MRLRPAGDVFEIDPVTGVCTQNAVQTQGAWGFGAASRRRLDGAWPERRRRAAEVLVREPRSRADPDRSGGYAPSIAVEVVDIEATEAARILSLEEDHFADLKAIEITPSKLTRTLCAFANAEGGDLYVGIDEDTVRRYRSLHGST